MKEYSVNHIIGIKTFNNLEHLEWSTPKEQYSHAVNTGLINFNTICRGSESSMSILKEYEVVEIYENPENLTIKELAIKYEVSLTTIGLIINDKNWTHITKDLNKNKNLKRLECLDVCFIYENPLNLNNKELALLFNKDISEIRRIFDGSRQSKFTKNLIPNEIKDNGKNFYKVTGLNYVQYFTNVNTYCTSNKKLKRQKVMELIKTGNEFNGLKFEVCSIEEYTLYLKKLYGEYLNSKVPNSHD